MPHVVNGIGTWYSGKRRRHVLRNPCDACGRYGDLESYDTTLYFVVVFRPRSSRSKKVRVLDNCPACSRHRVIPLKKWEQAKAESMEAVLAKVAAAPDDPAVVREGIGTACGFQDDVLFDRLVETMVDDRTRDADTLAAVAAGQAYFARHDEARRHLQAGAGPARRRADPRAARADLPAAEPAGRGGAVLLARVRPRRPGEAAAVCTT